MTATLYRVIPWDPGAPPGQPGHPAYVPPHQGRSRIGNPAYYRALYASESASGAAGEAFASQLPWTEAMLLSPRTGAARALVTYHADVALLDLDDGSVLAGRNLRPSEVASPDRKTTRTWALRVFQERFVDGIRWWSVRDSRWAVVGVWTIERVVPVEVEPLHAHHAALREAAERLGRPSIAR